MKQTLFFFFACFLSVAAIAQDVDVDKTSGLVTVDGKQAFYLTPKNKSVMHSDFALENLQHEELAYLKYTSAGNSAFFQMVFTKTGNQCNLSNFSMFSVMKPLAKQIAGANLVQNGVVSPTEERKFIILHNGNFLQDPAPQPERVVYNEAPKAPAGPADIALKENNIYNNSELVGVFRRTMDENKITTISVYNNTDALVCKASHPNDDNADWTILADGQTSSILYNPANPLEKLFKYLVEKGIL